jgi:L-2-hydroxyglutarate oxidase
MVAHSGEDYKVYDIAIVGAGVLGVSIAYWLSQLYDCSILLIDQAHEVAFHTSSRNTGVIHRPFYLNPKTKKVFAASAGLSYPMWHDLAKRFGLPWRQVGTLEVALFDDEVATLEKYSSWGKENGIPDDELELLDSAEVKALEPDVRCKAAIHSKMDVSVDFGAFSRCVFGMAQRNGAEFIGGLRVESVGTGRDGVQQLGFAKGGAVKSVACRYMVNAAGGGSIDIAHMLEVAKEFTDLHFRGDYWLVEEPFASRVARNIYSVARYPQFPFLDPHFVVRADGTRQIGPNAALVAGPFTYEGIGKGIAGKLLERPVSPKLRLFASGTFLSLVWTEWRSSVSKKAMCSRVNRFIPDLEASYLNRRGLSGVRSSVVGKEGFVPEAIQVEGSSSFHILNFNSPGATGAPAFSASVVRKMRESGALTDLVERPRSNPIWGFEEVIRRLDAFPRPDFP